MVPNDRFLLLYNLFPLRVDHTEYPAPRVQQKSWDDSSKIRLEKDGGFCLGHSLTLSFSCISFPGGS